MAKMYYTEQEAADKLGVSVSDLAQMVSQRKLRQYADGAKRMYKADEVDTLAGGGAEASGEIELTPADSGTADAVAISEGERPAGKEDTVITSEGISIFDEEDLEVEAADPMAKTTIAPGVEDQVSLEGVGSGSGLLDLTRESDDTSLGAEVLEHIDVEGAVPGASAVAEAVEAPPAEGAALMEQPMFVEAPDASAGLFAGLAAAAALVMLVIGGVAVAVIMDVVPAYVTALSQNVPIFLIAAVVVAGVLGAVGFLLGRSMAGRAAALQRGG